LKMLMRENSTLAEIEQTLTDFDVETVSLFGALTASQLVRLWGYLDVRQCAPGEHVFDQGDLPSNIFILISGRVDFVVCHGDLVKLERSFKGGDVFGETAFIGIQPQAGSAIVSSQGKVDLLVLNRDALMRIYADDTELFGMLMMNMARELSRKIHRMIGAA